MCASAASTRCSVSPAIHPQTIPRSWKSWPRSSASTPRCRPRRGTTHPDVQAAVTVIGRRNPRHDRQRLNLRSAQLPGADLRDANLIGADLAAADLSGSDLSAAEFAAANLSAANLSNTNLVGAPFFSTTLDRANLRGASWTRDWPPPRHWQLDDTSGRLVVRATDVPPPVSGS
jgi:hypothetical protein